MLNGNRYDAVTGALIGKDSESSHQQKAHKQQAKELTPAKTNISVASKTEITIPSPAKKADRSHHGQPKHVAHHKPQNSKTLMRRAVKKPAEQNKIPVKQQYPILVTKSGITVNAPKRLAHNVDPSRIARAQAVHKSHHVGRFQSQSLHAIKPHVIPVTVKEHAPAVAAPAAPKRPHATTPKKIDIFEQAIATATSHTEKPPKGIKTRRRLVNATAVLATVLVMSGFVFALNQPAIEMQIASMRAGFEAQEPRYIPQGYTKTDATVAGKAVSLNYESVNGTYTLKQESSNWNSQTLFDHINATYGSDYSVVYSNGRVIYIYGTHEATWVSGGILYTISGSSSLNPNDVAEIAASL